jgi:hypothetical protein
MNLSTRATNSYKRSLKAWMGYVHDSRWSLTFDCSLVDVLGALVQEDSDHLADFLSRYATRERDTRAKAVRSVVLHWLADLAE